MKHSVLVALLAAFAVVLVALIARFTNSNRSTKNTPKVKAKRLATENEQKMFWRLWEAFPQPEYLVFTQVAFAALMTSRDGSPRGFFDKKIADFVIAKKSFEVLAIIELDDRSHDSKQESDAARDAMLKSTGYRTLRYRTIPSVEKLQADIEALKLIQSP